MIGLALMAWKLAGQRVNGRPPVLPCPSVTREQVAKNPEFFNLSAEYYRILDSIAASVAPPWARYARVIHHAYFEYVWEAETEEFAAEEFGGTLITRERK